MVGQKKTRRERFFNEHPVCCFCGGVEPATTEDHIPSRAVFDDRQWPLGYSFPACERCNGATSRDEVVLSFLTRIAHLDDDLTKSQQANLQRAMQGMRNNFPEAYSSMRMSANEVRGFFKRRNVDKPQGALLSDVPVVSISHPEFRDAVKRFSTKLFCALHYKHAGNIVPTGASIGFKLFTNWMVDDGIVPNDILKIVGSRPALERSNNDLSDQFNYLYTVAIEKTSSVYLCAFRRSFAMIGFVSFEPLLGSEWREDFERGSFLTHPLTHESR